MRKMERMGEGRRTEGKENRGRRGMLLHIVRFIVSKEW